MRYSDNYNLKLPQRGVDRANVEDLDSNFETIDGALADDRQIGLLMYDSTATYNTGAIRGYENPTTHRVRAYRCLEDNVTGPWDATKWAQTTLAAEIEAGGGGGGSSTLAGLSDVDLDTPADGEVLTYDATEGKWVNANAPDVDVTKTTTGNPIEISDGANAPLVKCVSAITGSQDLHGYDKPWVGGAGKNKCPVDSGSFIPVSTWISLSNIGASTYSNGTEIKLSNGTYTYSFTDVTNVNVLQLFDSDGNVLVNNSSESGSFTIDTSGTFYIRVRVSDTSRTFTFKIQIELGSSATAWTPYSNICPITAYNQSTISVGGHNIYDGEAIAGYIYNGITYSSTTYKMSKNYIPVKPNTSYKAVGVNGDGQITCYSKSKTYLSSIAGMGGETRTFTTPADCYFIKFYNPNAYMEGNVGINYPSTFTEYEPHSVTTHTATYPSAIYRGSADFVGGEVTEEWATVVLDGSNDEEWKYNSTNAVAYISLPNCLVAGSPIPQGIYTANNLFMDVRWSDKTDAGSVGLYYNSASAFIKYSQITSVADVRAFLATNPMQLAYKVATPTTSSVTPTNLPVKSLNGYTHIESSTGDMEIEYITGKYQPIVDLISESSDNQHHYSTDEQVVGTWIDGSTVYEKVYEFSSTFTMANGNQWYNTSFSRGDIDLLIDIVGVQSSGSVYSGLIAGFDSGYISLLTYRYTDLNAFILRYTKTAATRSLSKGTTETEKTSLEPISEPLETKTDSLSKEETELKEEDESKEIEEITEEPEEEPEEPTEEPTEEPVDPEPSKEEADER